MAVPKKRTGASAQGHRRANWKASVPETTTCKNCNALVLTHTVCAECGYYKGSAVSIKNPNYVETSERNKNKVLDSRASETKGRSPYVSSDKTKASVPKKPAANATKAPADAAKKPAKADVPVVPTEEAVVETKEVGETAEEQAVVETKTKKAVKKAPDEAPADADKE